MKIAQFFFLFLASLFMTWGCSSEHQAEKKSQNKLPSVKASVHKAELTSAYSFIEIPGTVQAGQRATIATKLTGTISELPVTMGSRVSKGDLLVKIDAQEITARVNQARTQLEQAQRNLKREEKLLAQNASTPETVKDLQDMVRISSSTLNEAQTMQGYTRISAPFDGMISEKRVDVGDLAMPGVPLLVLDSEKSLQVLADVPEETAIHIKQGDPQDIYIPASGKKIKGRVAELSHAADPATRTVAVKLDIESDPDIRPGQFARILIPSRQKTLILVPQKAISLFGQMERLFILQSDNRASLRIVRSGARSGEMVEILTGLEPEEKVIISDETLHEGQPIEVVH